MIILQWGILIGPCLFIAKVARKKGQNPVLWFILAAVLLYFCVGVTNRIMFGPAPLTFEATAVHRWLLINTSISAIQCVRIEYLLYEIIGVAVGATPLLIYLGSKSKPQQK